MNSLDKQARKQLVDKLNKIYVKGSGISGGKMKKGAKKVKKKGPKKGEKKGAKKNNYINYLKKYKGMSKTERPAYDKSTDYGVKGGSVLDYGGVLLDKGGELMDYYGE